ncbi:MAG: copper amine oxidase N-terminal domain-containing protein [Defluviitaleaceae bacterium]|nr:copper amine oxidase N-terminal domain-containing protein [Defluviitaleaceae bacterium]
MKKLIASLLAAILFMAAVSSVTTHAAALGSTDYPAFSSFSGTVEAVQAISRTPAGHAVTPGTLRITIINENGGRAIFITTPDAFLADGVNLTVGASLTGWFDTNAPTNRAYPPTYDAIAFTLYAEGPPFVKFDRFDENLLSFDGQLKLNVSEDTPIILQDGTEFQLFGQTVEEALANRKLLVFYSITTRSIPPQTPPDLIVVFFEIAVHPIGVLPPYFELPTVTLPAQIWLPSLNDIAVAGEITDVLNLAGGDQTIVIRMAEGGTAHFVTSVDTFVDAGVMIEVGARITAWFDARLPVALIYPPRYHAVALTEYITEFIPAETDGFVAGEIIGVFRLMGGGQTISVRTATGSVAHFVTNDETIINVTLETGSWVTGWFDGNAIIPAIYPPRYQAIAFTEYFAPFIPECDDSIWIDDNYYFWFDEDDFSWVQDIFPPLGTLVLLVVEGELVGEVPLHYTERGIVLVPIRAVADALNVTLGWDGDTSTVTWGDVSFVAGEDTYAITGGAEITLGTPSTIINGRTFVPLSFFHTVLGMNNAFFFEGQIDINNFEHMEIWIDEDGFYWFDEDDFSWVQDIFPPLGTLVPIVVEGELIGEVSLQYTERGIVLVPICVVADALGVTLELDGEAGTVTWGDVSFVIGEDFYTIAGGMEIVLGTPSTVIDGLTFVPLSFFRIVLGMNNAFFFEGQIDINNFERME